jgi:DNA/RNA-binding protein KIN17
VYQEYIADKNHIHMNATCWSSLTGLCKHLGKEGMCVVDETEKGWFVQYIDRDPKLRAKQEAMESRQIAELDEQERVQLAIEAQREAARRALGIDSDAESAEGATELMKDDADAPLSLTLSFSSAVGGGGVASKRTLGAMDGSGEGGAAGAAAAGPSLKRIAAVFGDDEEDDIPKGTTTRDSKTSTASAAAVSASSHHASGGSAVSALESIRQDEERRKQALLAAEESRNRRDYWLHPGIVVKVLNKKVSDGKYYKLKADVVRVIDDYVGEVKVHNLNSILQLDQQDLETVIPKVILHPYY